MGIFGASGPEDSSLANLLVDTGPEGYRKKNALKALATCEPALQQLRAAEGLTVLAHDCSPTQVGARVVAVTNSSVAVITKKGIERKFRFDEIAETRLGRVDRGILVMVDTHKARNFMPDDARRMAQCIDFQVASPGAANAVCGLIDRHL